MSPLTIEQAMQIALGHHQAGRLAEAEALYRQVLAQQPEHGDALHSLGVLACQAGRPDVAVELIGRAIATNPAVAEYHGNLGEAYRQLRQWDAAIAGFERAIELKPELVDPHNNLGLALEEQGRLVEAIAAYGRAIALRPDLAEVFNNMGNALGKTGQRQEEIAAYQRALELKPDFGAARGNLGTVFRVLGRLPEAVWQFEQALRLRPSFAQVHNNLGNTLLELGRFSEALVHLEQAGQLLPRSAEVHNNLGNALRELGRLDEALERFDRAVMLRPGYVEAHNNRGITLRKLDRLDEARACFQEAVRLRPGFADAHNNLGVVYRELNRFPDAFEQFDRAVEAEPENVIPHWNRALLWLLEGNLARGWPEYEWRWGSEGTGKLRIFADRGFAQPRWDGSPLQGRTILVTAEQGLGDTLQFLRYLPLVKERGGTVVFECQEPLVPLLTANLPAGIDQLVVEKSPLPPFDVHVPLLSLPLLFDTTLATVPAAVPYLRANQRLVDQWQRELTRFPGVKVGIAWQGNPTTEGDRRRSIALECFEPLARLPGVHLISVQRGPGCEQVGRLDGRFEVTVLSDRFDEAGAFVDRAAVIENLDLFVTSDSAIAHLAGALGVPVWVALSLVPDWRWLLEREDSPWYPTMRLFRQTGMGDWRGVFGRIASALESWLPTARERRSRNFP